MASVTGRGGHVTRQVTGVDTIVSGVKEWSVDYTVDMLDITEFAESAPTYKSYLPIIKGSTGSIVGNHTDGDTGLTLGTAYNLFLLAHSGRAYYGSAYITNKGVSITVDGEANTTYSFEFTGKVYVLGADVVADGAFTAASSAAWDVSDADISYDTTGDQIDWAGAGDLVPASNNVIVTTTDYWTQMLLENESGTTSCTLKLGTTSGTARTTNGTYTEIITSAGTTFTVSVTTDGALSLSELQIRTILN